MFNFEQRPAEKPGTTSRSKALEKQIDEDNPELKELLEKRRKRRQRIDDKYDTGFWTCLVFSTAKQKEEFIKQMRAKGVPDLFDGLYIDGQTMAEALGIELPDPGMNAYKTIVQKRLAGQVIPSERERAGISLG